MKSKHTLLPLTAVAALALTALPVAYAQTILSDTFNRTDGLADTPANGGFSSWGANNNGLGGSATGAYLTSNATTANQQTVNGSQGEIRSGRTILDYNLALDATVLGAGGFSVSLDIDPDGASNGRNWGGIILSGSNDPGVMAGSGALDNKNNTGTRLGLALRNSGSIIRRINSQNGAEPDSEDLFFGNGTPGAANFNEPIFDQTTFDFYTATYGPTYNTPWEQDLFYTLRLDVVSASFAAGAGALAYVYVNNVQVDMDLNAGGVNPASFTWGDSADSAFLMFVGFGGTDAFDNLVVTAVPEPASAGLLLMGAAGLLALRRGRRA